LPALSVVVLVDVVTPDIGRVVFKEVDGLQTPRKIDLCLVLIVDANRSSRVEQRVVQTAVDIALHILFTCYFEQGVPC